MYETANNSNKLLCVFSGKLQCCVCSQYLKNSATRPKLHSHLILGDTSTYIHYYIVQVKLLITSKLRTFKSGKSESLNGPTV